MNGPESPGPFVDRPAVWAPHTWSGGWWSPEVRCVVCANPSPMTLEGTNTWILGAPGAGSVLVVDPGPRDEAHQQAVLAAVGAREVGAILLTHRHPDHAGGAERLAELSGATVRTSGTGPGELRGGERIREAGVELLVVPTPGHSDDSVSFCLVEQRALITGDTILGWGSTVVAWPHGVLADYLDSLDHIAELTDTGQVTALLPGHGGPVADAAGVVRRYQAHRRQRLEQVRAARAAGCTTVEEVVAAVYAEVDRALWPAAAQSVRAQLDYLDR